MDPTVAAPLVTAFLTELFKFGLPGIFIAYLAYKNQRLESQVEDKVKFLNEIQEKRISEAITFTNAANALAGSNESISKALSTLDDRLEAIERNSGLSKR